MDNSTEKAAGIDAGVAVEEEQTFEDLGLDPRLIRALTKLGITKPTPVQRLVIPKIFEGTDVVAQASTGSGKTLAYVLPLLQKLFSDSASAKKLAPTAFILVPTIELIKQVQNVVFELIGSCRVPLIVRSVSKGKETPDSDLGKVLAECPDILISTPGGLKKCFSAGCLQPELVKESLSFLILDEADYMLSHGYENDLKDLTSHVPRGCQRLLLSATSSADTEKLIKQLLHDPCILDMLEAEEIKEQIVPQNVRQSWISCSSSDKLLYILALLKLGYVQKKVLIFTNAIDMSFRLKLFLEQFGIKSAVLNAELPYNSRLHILERFNAGLFDYLIATDENHSKKKEQDGDREVNESEKVATQKLDSEYSVARGVDFKNVHTVINFQLPESLAGYVHRIGRTGRAYNTGESISLVCPEEMENFEGIKCSLGDSDGNDSKLIAEYSFLSKNSVESLRYRSEDVARSVTKIAVREARAQDLRNEILNSEKLKAHFQDNPKDLDLLKHDKILSSKAPPRHLRELPEYLLDQATMKACEMVKLTRADMGRNTNHARGKGFKAKARSRDPLKTFSKEAPRQDYKGARKRKGNDRDDGRKPKRKQLV